MIIVNKKIKKPLISIITVSKNSSKTMQRCIDSVARQSFKNYEHIVIDGDSKDSTVEIIKKNQKFIRYAETKKDTNLWQAINRGITISKGEIIGILNSDDVLFSKGLSIVNKYFKKKNIDYLFGSVLKNKIYSGFYPNKINYKFNVFPSHSVSFFVKKIIYKKYGLYNEKLDYCSDYDFIYRLVKKNLRYSVTKKTEILGRFYPGGISEKINIYNKIFYESKVRILNKQNLIIVILLAFGHFLNFFRNKFNFYK
jgi:glycosyltransferase involved in cell wall biosynthesis